MLPFFVATDHSYEHGGSSIQEYIESATAKNIKRLGIIDSNTMAGTINFVQSCRKAGIEHIVGVRLSVYHSEVSETMWKLKNQAMLNKVVSTLGLPDDFDLPFTNWLLFLDSLLAYHTSTAKTKLDILGKKLEGVVDVSNLTISPEIIKGLRPFIAKYDKVKPLFFVTAIAKSAKGYKSLLYLTSLKAKKVKDSHEGAEDFELALTLKELQTFNEDVVYVDGLEQDSLLGVLVHNDIQAPQTLLTEYNESDYHLGISHSAKASVINYVKELELKCIPYSYARFSESYGFEDFCIKYSILTKKPYKSFLFNVPISENDYLHSPADVEKGSRAAKKALKDKLQNDFWEAFPSTDVTLNKVVLPNCDIPENEVSEYACLHLGISDVSKCGFESWIKDTLPEGMTYAEHRRSRFEAYYMHKLSFEGVMRKLKIDFPDDFESRADSYIKQHTVEFDIIDDMGFSGYFLIMYDIVSYARKIGVPVGEARGSAAGSLIVYGLDITDVDPIFYDLKFERFLNPERVSMPDIDVDFGHNGTVGRDDVLAYVREKYSSPENPFSSVSQISNTNRFMLKKALAAACEAFGLPQAYKKYVTNLVKDAESEFGIRAPEVIKWDDLLKYEVLAEKMKNEPVLYRVISKAQALFKKKETSGVHAGGLVISPTIVPDFSPLALDASGNYVCEFDKDDIETAGLIKFDLLGLEYLSVLAEANGQIAKRTGSLVDIRNIPKDDPEVYALINRNVTLGIFQIESEGMRGLISELQPENIGEIAVLSALFRPGALQSGMVEDFVDTKHGRKPLTYDHPEMEIATKDTYGCIVYQEQVMSIVRLLAGYSLGEADQLRRAMGKKKIEEMMRLKTEFTRRAQAYWRDSYIEKGKAKFTEFSLDPNLSDLSERFPELSFEDYLIDGYFSEVRLVESFLQKLLGLGTESQAQLHRRIADINYTVKIFKDDYYKAIYTSVSSSLNERSEMDVIEVQTRIYFALTQWVRFNWIFNKIEKFAGYGFNKSHAVGYSLITYSTAFFKTHYSPEYYSALLSHSKLKRVDALTKEAVSKMQVRVLKPSVNSSFDRFSTEGKMTVRYGLGKLDGVASAGKAIELARGDVPFESLHDYIYRCGKDASVTVKKTVFYGLALSGAFDDFIPTSIAKHKDINGRLFIYELLMALKACPFFNFERDEVEIAEAMFHKSLKNMSLSDVAIYYLTALSANKAVAWLNINASVDKDALNSDGGKLIDVLKCHEISLKSSLKPPSKKATVQYDNRNIRDAFDKAKSALEGVEIEDHIESVLSQSFNMPLVEAVNIEKEICGMYLTMSPLDAIDAFKRIEREPPSSMVDGCPIRLGDVDEDIDGESIMTLGVIRNVVSKQVMNPDSDWFTQKILEFHLEDGLELVKFSVFGTRPVNKVAEMLEEGNIIMAVGKVKYEEKFGLSVSLEAFKRYYPVEDEALTRVPRVTRR